MRETVTAQADVTVIGNAMSGSDRMAGHGELPGEEREKRDRRAAGQVAVADAGHPRSLLESRRGDTAVRECHRALQREHHGTE